MRIGLVHNYYRSEIPSGENLTVDQIALILNSLGHTVSIYSETSDKYKKNLRIQALRMFRLLFGLKKKNFKKWIEEQDSIQIHNYFPLIGRAELKALSRSGLPIVRVIHNYRKTCLIGNHFRNNEICKKCNQSKFRSGILKRCYQRSFWKSLLVSKMTREVNNFENTGVIKFIAISEHVKKYLLEIGVDSEKISLIPNGIKHLKRINGDANQVLFLSRLEPEKGVKLVIKTWLKFKELPKLNIIGTGSLNDYVIESIATLKNVEFHGLLNASDIDLVAAKCRTFLAPVSWEEPFGRTLVEALSRGQAVVATKMGIAPFIIQEGINGFFCDASVKSLESAIVRSQDLDLLSQVSISTGIWSRNFSIEVISQIWKNFYDDMGNFYVN